MFKVSTFKIQSKRVEIPKGELYISDLTVSFNEMYRDYVIYYPGHTDWYITNIVDIELGFGPRYLLYKLLKDVEKANPDGTVDSGSVVVKTIPVLPEPLTRRLGQLAKQAESNEENPASFTDYKASDPGVEDKALENQNRNADGETSIKNEKVDIKNTYHI